MSDELLTERRDRVLVITLNRPDARNALNGAIADGLVAAFDELDADVELGAGILTGAGKGFCSGMDLKAFGSSGPPKALGRVFEERTKKPLIGAIEGFAVAGGLELALCCDFLVAGRNAKLGIPEVGVGLFAAGGALFHLPRRIPYGLALELALTADPIRAERAYEVGLINRIAEPGQALDVAFELAERIARNAPLGLTASKELMTAALDMTEKDYWDFQKPLMARVFKSNDAKEGPRSFAEKRSPNWTGS
jgi:enoyl-CoA hydratase